MVPGSTLRESRAARFGRSPWAGAIIIALCLLAQWPGVFSIPPIDRDESRFAQATRQIVEAARAGDVENMIIPRVQDRPRLNKPPLIYWVQAVPAAAFDRPEAAETNGPRALPTGNVWAFRLPSLLCALATALLTWRMGLALRLHPMSALMGGAFMATCLIEMVDARQARADELLVTLTLATQLCLWRVWSDRKKGPHRASRAPILPALAFWIFLALGVMTKGPITPMVAMLTALALSLWDRDARWLRRLRPIPGILLVALIVAAWVVPVVRIIGFHEYWSIVWGETAGRAGSARESHWGPPGYHLVLLVVLLFPGTLFTAAGVIDAFKRVFGERAHTLERAGMSGSPRAHEAGRSGSSNQLPLRVLRALGRLTCRRGGRDCEAFLLAWIVPSWLVFEFVATKLPHYTLPLYPAVALVSARALVRAAGKARGRDDLGARLGKVVYFGLGSAIVVGLPLALTLWSGTRDESGHAAAWWLLPAIGLALILMGGAGVLVWPGGGGARLLRAQWLVIGATVIASVCIFGVLLPHASDLWVSSKLVQAMERIAADESGRGGAPFNSRPIGSVGYQEDSLVFLTRGRLERVRRDDGASWLDAHPGGLLVVEIRKGDEGLGDTAGQVAAGVLGFNYSKGQWVRLEIRESGTLPIQP